MADPWVKTLPRQEQGDRARNPFPDCCACNGDQAAAIGYLVDCALCAKAGRRFIFWRHESFTLAALCSVILMTVRCLTKTYPQRSGIILKYCGGSVVLLATRPGIPHTHALPGQPLEGVLRSVNASSTPRGEAPP